MEARVEAPMEAHLEARMEALVEACVKARVEAQVEVCVKACVDARVEVRVEAHLEARVRLERSYSGTCARAGLHVNRSHTRATTTRDRRSKEISEPLSPKVKL